MSNAEELSVQEINLRWYGGCSICKIGPFAARGHPQVGFMCVHAASLTQADVDRLRGNAHG